MNHVIIGNGTAAVGCIEAIRVADKESPITIISDEPYPVYGRPLISYLLLGKTTEQNMLHYRPESFYADNRVTALLGRTATRIDPAAKKVILDGGKSVAYDKLCIATGSQPFIPPIDGLESVSAQTPFMTLDHAKRLRDLLGTDKKKRVLIVGAGLIGLKCAEGILHLAREITVIDLATRILPNVLHEQPAGVIQTHMEKKGVKFLLGDSVAQFGAQTACLKSGKTVDFDVLVMAVGVRPNTSLAAGAGCAVSRGIVLDDHMRTTVPDIYAAGDCTLSHDISAQTDRILAILPNAYLQGETAGINMAGGDRAFVRAVPMNASGFMGLHMITAGCYDGQPYVEQDEETGAYKLLVTKDDQLKGFILIGSVERAGIYTALIRDRVPLKSIDFDLIRERPQLMAFSSTERVKKLGRAH